MAKKFKKQYFLFGEQVCRTLDTEGLKEALKSANDNGYSIYEWNENSSPAELLGEYDGWNAYMEITKKEYEAFAKL
jgi:hypothetical protein